MGAWPAVGWSREGTSLPPAAQGLSPAQLLVMCDLVG